MRPSPSPISYHNPVRELLQKERVHGFTSLLSLKFSRPLPRRVKHPQNFNRISLNPIRDNVRSFGNDQLSVYSGASALIPSFLALAAPHPFESTTQFIRIQYYIVIVFEKLTFSCYHVL